MRRGRLREATDATGAAPDAVVTTLAVVPAIAERSELTRVVQSIYGRPAAAPDGRLVDPTQISERRPG